MKRAWPRLAACVCAVSAGAAFADEPVEFDRPGTGFSASVLAPGSVVWEQGLPDSERDAGDGVRTTTHTFDSVLRIGLGIVFCNQRFLTGFAFGAGLCTQTLLLTVPAFVGFNNFLNQLVTHDVTRMETGNMNFLDVLQHAQGMRQTRLLTTR